MRKKLMRLRMSVKSTKVIPRINGLSWLALGRLAAFSLVSCLSAHTFSSNQGLAEELPAGGIETKIVGGSDVSISDFPWQVALMNEWNFQFCGGSIVGERWILTAAHCYTPQLSYVRAGVTNKNSDLGQDIDVLRQIQYPSYDARDLDNDVMLLKLAEPLDLSGPNVKKIQIMTPEAALGGLQDPGVMAVITGWGSSAEGGSGADVLQRGVVPIVSNQEASDIYEPLYGPGIITSTMLAAGYSEGGIDTCQGDSGGPLAVPDPTTELGFRLAGITSWGVGCARPNFPSIYTRVSEFDDWIVEYLDLPDRSPEPEEPSFCYECLPSINGWRSFLYK
jgi:secreted trypsin-like serine protease